HHPGDRPRGRLVRCRLGRPTCPPHRRGRGAAPAPAGGTEPGPEPLHPLRPVAAGRRLRTVAPCLALALAGVGVACGKKGDPLAPLPRAPQAVADLHLLQRGDKLEARYTTPRATAGGQPLLGLVDVELWLADQAGEFDRLARRQVRKVAPGERV